MSQAKLHAVPNTVEVVLVYLKAALRALPLLALVLGVRSARADALDTFVLGDPTRPIVSFTIPDPIPFVASGGYVYYSPPVEVQIGNTVIRSDVEVGPSGTLIRLNSGDDFIAVASSIFGSATEVFGVPGYVRPGVYLAGFSGIGEPLPGPGQLGTTLTITQTPEPASFALLGTGLLGVVGVVRKRFA